MVFSFPFLNISYKKFPGGKFGVTMIIYEDGTVREVECVIYEPFPEPAEDEEEGSRESQRV